MTILFVFQSTLSALKKAYKIWFSSLILIFFSISSALGIINSNDLKLDVDQHSNIKLSNVTDNNSTDACLEVCDELNFNIEKEIEDNNEETLNSANELNLSSSSTGFSFDTTSTLISTGYNLLSLNILYCVFRI